MHLDGQFPLAMPQEFGEFGIDILAPQLMAPCQWLRHSQRLSTRSTSAAKNNGSGQRASQSTMVRLG
jgi:hypothetical protein